MTLLASRARSSASTATLGHAGALSTIKIMTTDYRFSFGPWNIHEGADPFGPPVRPTVAFAEKLKHYKKLGFDAVQFHDDDAVPDIDSKTPGQLAENAKAMKKMLDDHGLVPEFVAPR